MTRNSHGVSGLLDVYVLGAGASFVHGAPLTDQLIPYALTLPGHAQDPRFELLRQFLRDVFHFEAPRTPGASGWSDVPGLVDLLSMVDVALDRKDSLSPEFDVEGLRQVRTSIEAAIFSALEHSLARPPKGRPATATSNLVARLDPRSAVILSFNYDIIVDVALAKRAIGAEPGLRRVSYEDMAEVGGGEVLRHALDYGVDFANVPADPDARRFRLLKLHGSLNWLRHRVTGDLYYGGLQKAARVAFASGSASVDAMDLHGIYNRRPGSASAVRPGRSSDFEPVMVTPTHLKDLRNPHLSRIWRRAEELLRQARTITFIGYSLPGDDLHVKYLFKRALETRPAGTKPPRIVVVGKGPARTSDVKRNYERFFGRKHVTYDGRGFEAWIGRRPR